MEYLWAYDPYTDSFHLEEEESPYVPPWYFYSPRQRRKIELAGKMHCIHSSMQGFGPDLEHACEGCLGKLKKDLKEEAKDCYDEQDFEAAYRYYSNCLEVCQCGNGIYLPSTDWEFVRISYTNRAVCCYRRGDCGLVIQDCEAALRLIEFLKLPPKSRQKPLYWKAMALKKLHRYTDAWSTAEQCKRIASDDSYIRTLMEKIRPMLPPGDDRRQIESHGEQAGHAGQASNDTASSNVSSIRALLPPDDDQHQAESQEEQAGHTYQVSSDTDTPNSGSKQADVSVPEEARTEESDTSTKSKTTHQIPVDTPKKSKKQSKAERRRKEMERFDHKLQELAKEEAEKEERNKQPKTKSKQKKKKKLKAEKRRREKNASESAGSQSEAAAFQDGKEMASNDKEHQEDTDVSGHEEMSTKEEESGGEGEEIEKRKDKGDDTVFNSHEGSIDEELQEESGSRRVDVSVPEEAETEKSDTSTKSKTTHQTPVVTTKTKSKKNKRQLKAAAERRRKEIEEIGHQLPEEEKQGLKEEQKKQKASEKAVSQSEAAALQDEKEMASNDSKEHEEHTDVSGDEKIKRKEEESGGKGEEIEERKRNGDDTGVISREGSIVEELQEEFIAANTIFARNPVCGPSPTHSSGSSSSPSFGPSSSTSSLISGASANDPDTIAPVGAASTLVSGKYEFLLACDGCFVQEKGLHGVGAFSYKISTNHRCKGNILLARNRNSGESFKKIRPILNRYFMGTYELCRQFQESCPCKIGESRCTFAHNEIERDLWTREREKAFNRKVVTVQLRAKNPDRWLKAKSSCCSLTNSPDTSTGSSGAAEPVEESSIGDLRRRVYDYKLACEVCFVRDESKHGVGAYTVRNKKHNCSEDVLLARKKNTDDAFKKVRPRPQHAFFGTYKLCQQFQSAMPCMLGEPRCTFTHNEIEIDLWTRERQGKFNRDELMSQLSKSSPSEADAVKRLRQKHGGVFRFLCKECFQGSPTVISDSSLCDRHLGQRQADIELLVHARETSKGEIRFTPIMPLPQLTANQIPLFCAYMDKCTFGGGRCGRAHGQVEMDVWMLERKYGTSQRQLVTGSSNATRTRPIGNVPAQWRHVECPFRLQFVCRQCWLSGGGVVSEVSTNGKTCKRNIHAWNEENKMCLSIGARKEIRKMPEKFIFKFEMCHYAQPGKCCFLGKKCTFAHSEEEMKIWTFQKETKLRDLEVLVNLSQQQHGRPSTPTTPSPQASPRTSDFPLLTPRISQYYCNLCHRTCNGKVTFDQHCSSEGHQARLRSDASDNWQYRRPPWIGQTEEYKLCQRHAVGLCPYDGVEDRHNICPDAHSLEELDEWKERRQHRWLNMEMARKQNLFSYMDKLMEEYEKTTDGPSVIADSLKGVSITCTQDESILLKNKGAKCTWAFTVTSKEPLEHVALLFNQHRTHFSLHGTELERNCQVAEGKRFSNPSDNTYHVEVQGTSQMFGVFHQWVVFDFGKRPVVNRRVVLYVGSAGSDATVQVKPDPPDFERWHSGNRSIVKFAEGLGPEDEALLAKYKEPTEEKGEVLARFSQRKKELDETVYKTRMHDLLYLEELTRNREIASIRKETTLELSDRIEDGILLFADGGTLYTKLRLQDQLSEDGPAGKLILTSVSTVLLAPKGCTINKVYEAAIVQLKGFEGRRKEEIYLQLSSRCCQDLDLSSGTTVEFEVRFQLNRLHFCYMHFAVDKMAALHAIFPGRADMSWVTVVESLPTRQVQDAQLNTKQRTAVTRILSRRGDANPPVLLYGPFGTGKTRTMASSALQILQQPGTNVLIATHSNSAADLYVKEYIHPYVTSGHPEATPLRVYFKERRLETVDDTVLQYCKLDPDQKSFAMPQIEDITNHRIVIVTLTTSMYLIRMGMKRGHFTHILLDEAAQAMECETILPLCLADPTTRIVLSGDHKQISPKVHSTEACELSFDMSLLQRMVQRYIRFGKGPTEKAENPFLVMLTDNYRCCEEILRFLSESFYGGLKSVGQPRHPRWYPLTFFSAEGDDKTGDYSTSYFNMAEVLEIAERVEKLWKDWPEEWGPRNMADIGVITPYHNQTQLIRKELRQKRLGGVTVEMVTNIQGKQFRAVFISTVRTRATCAQNNDKNSYGFLSDSKLLNTAMTRAQSLVAVVGDPHALCSRGECQRVWHRFIFECEKNKSLFPQTLTMSQIYETSESTPLNPKAQPFTPKGPATPWSQGASAPSSTPEKIDEPDEIIRQLILESLEDENEEEARRFKAETFDPNKVAVVQSQRDPSQVYLHYSSGQRASVRRPARPRLERPRLGADNADREYDSGEDEPYDPTQLEVQEESDNQCFYTNYPPEELENLLQTEPDQYRRCRLVVKGTYTAYAEVIGSDEDDIVINSRKNRGLGWSNDEVVVKILENTDQESAEVFTTSSDTKRGKVVGIIKSAVSLHLRKFVCVVDGNNHNVMVPINTDAPKLMTYFGKENRRHNKVRVYSYMSDGSFRFRKYEDIDPMDPYKKMFVVRFLKWTPRYVYPLGVVTDVITPDSTLDTSMEIINNRFNVPSKYKGKVEEDVNRRYFVDWQIPQKERHQRNDLSRTHTVFTVDPPEAMDLDDAFSVETNLDGTHTVGMHIADVSYFLPAGSDLDKEAKERSTTLYNHTGKPPVHMIPKRLSEGVCSLLPNRDRLALSLFVKFNSDGDVVGEPTMERCVVHSRAKLSYAQAEDIIAGWGSSTVPREVRDSIRILHTVAEAHRQKRLGPAHLYHQPDEDKDTAVKAHTMVEEMMILANTTVAQVLLQSFPQTTPIRKQQPPKKEKLENWRKRHACLNGYSVELAKSLPNDVGDNTDAPPEDIPLRKDVWDEIRRAAFNGDLDTIQQLVCTDENHPTLSRALLQLRGIQDRAMFTCSEDEQRRHHSLNQSAYTYFSSPIRRYIDIVVHRLLVALISKQPPPYTSDEIKEICSHYNNMENNAKTYERETLVLKLAYDWMTKPEVMYPVIDTVDGQEIQLLMPSVRHTESRQRRVAFSLLKPTALPAPEDEGESVEVRWKQRIYDTAPDKTKLPWPSDRKKPLRLDSEKYVIRIPGQYWQRLVQHVQTGNMGFIRDVVTYIEDVVGMQLTLGPRVYEEVSSEAREGLFADHFCTFQMTYTPGQVVKVQLTGDMRKGLLSPCIQLFNLTPKMDVCLDHRRDAVTRFAVPATRSVGNMTTYRSVQMYQDRWLPIMAVEAAHCAVENNDSVIVHSTFISWKKREQTTGGVAYFGEITLSQKFCKDRCIYFNQDNQSNLAAVNDFKKHFDYICVRYTGVRAAMTHGGHFDIATDKSEENSPLVCWVGHCLVMPGVQFSKREDGTITVPIKLHQHLMAFPDALIHHGTSIPATIEIIIKTLPDRRMENAVRWLSGSSDLVQQIATGKPITAEGNPLASEVTIQPLPAFFPLNQVQEQAVKQAIRQPFTLIQGPPGTGKTVTGVHIAYYLVQMNKLIQSVSGEGMYPPQVLYCGPSNKAVDVVTGYMKRIKSDLKIVRMYSDMIEKEEFPIPNEPVHPNKCKSEKESKLTSEHDDVSLHHLIRKPGNPYAEAIRAFETLFKDPNYTVTEKDVTDYKIRVMKAKVHELRQKHVILCTCTAAASPKMGMATNIEQCIVDECGMCTEPESFVPIVGAPVDRNGSATFHNPKQVILIGDHQQLRPIVLEKTSQQLGLDTSLFQRYAWQATMLTTQYRMHEAICSFPSRMFYENKLRTHQSVTARPRHPTLDDLWPGGVNRPTAFCHVVGREEVQTVATAEGNQMSRSNETEADMAGKMAISLVREHNIQPENIILLSQYRAQCALINKKLSVERKKLNDVRLERVGVNSVVASQGSEWDYVIFSTVRSLPSYEIEQNPSPSWLRKYLGFIMDQNQVNVAITRAKRGLCIIGNKNLLRVHSLWNKLITDYEEHKCLVNNTNFLQLTRTPSQQNAWRSQQFSGGIGTS